MYFDTKEVNQTDERNFLSTSEIAVKDAKMFMKRSLSAYNDGISLAPISHDCEEEKGPVYPQAF